MKKVLILGVASVQADAVMVLKDLGYEVFTIARSNDGPASKIADHFEEIDILNLEAIESYIEENGIEAVYSTGSDLAMPVACKLSEKLNLPHFVTHEVAFSCNNKEVMRNKLIGAYGNVPFLELNKEDKENIKTLLEKSGLTFPLIMKPTDSQGQRGIVFVENVETIIENFDFVVQYSRAGKVILEKFVKGPEFSVNGYVVDGEVVFMLPTERVTWPQFTGLIHKHVYPSQFINETVNKRLETLIKESCANMGIVNGPVYFQVIIDNDHPYIIEMTPRLDGCHMWKLIQYSTGLNLMKLTFEHLLLGNTEEIKNLSSEYKGYQLEFLCQEPNTAMKYDQQDFPEDSIETYLYYKIGDNIRPVNGKFEKVGYSITTVG